jgi:dTDP-4-dehydrorhamnose reductase
LVLAFRSAGHDVLPLVRPAFDLLDPGRFRSLLDWRPDVVVNSAAWTDVEGCARDPARAMAVNGDATGDLASAAGSVGAVVVQISTNEVFDGSSVRPYRETDRPNPVNPYGASKLRAEELVLAADARSIVVRTAWLFGPRGRNFVTKVLDAATQARLRGESLGVVEDEWGNPTWAPFLARDVVRLIDHGAIGGIYHLAGEPPTSRFDWASRFVDRDVTLKRISLASFKRDSRVPPRAVLSTAKARSIGISQHDWTAVSIDLARSHD